jgi:hypothetical protein
MRLRHRSAAVRFGALIAMANRHRNSIAFAVESTI